MRKPRTSEQIIAETDVTLQHTLRLQQQFVWLQVELERTRTRLERTRRNIEQTRRELRFVKTRRMPAAHQTEAEHDPHSPDSVNGTGKQNRKTG